MEDARPYSVSGRFIARQRATRESGRCIVCHVARPREARAVCEACNDKAKERVRRARAQARSNVAARYESAGDDATRRFAHRQAASDYERAFARTGEDASRARLAEKLGNVVYLCGDPLEARGWLLQALERYTRLGNNEARVLLVLLRLARQYWLEADTANALVVIDKALAGISPERDLAAYLHASVLKAAYLNLLDRYDEAERVVTAIAPQIAAAPVEAVAAFHRVRGVIAAVKGRRDESFASFERCREYAVQLRDGYALVGVLDEHAYRAIALGETRAALACREHAIMIARERRTGWNVVWITLEHANVLHLVGEDERAAALVREVLGASDEAPTVRILLAAVGIPIAIAIEDETLLRRCSLYDAIDLAFASQEPDRILRVAAAFGELLYRDGRRSEGDALVRRALPFVRIREDAWPLAVLALRRSEDPALRRAVMHAMRAVRGPRTCATVAMQRLCAALSGNERGRCVAAATDALRMLRDLGWLSYARVAEEVLKGFHVRPARIRARRTLGTFEALKPKLTRREYEVAQLALSGSTNKSIATSLGISEHTVESHMTSILARLELRSRWQLLQAADGAPPG